MKYKNISQMRQVLVINGKKTQLLPDAVLESDRELKFVFLEQVDDKTPVTVQAGTRFSSVLNLQQKVSSLEQQKNQFSQDSSAEIQKLTEANDQLQSVIQGLMQKQETLEFETERKLEMMKSAIMMIQEDFYNVEFDENGKQVEKDPTFRPTP